MRSNFLDGIKLITTRHFATKKLKNKMRETKIICNKDPRKFWNRSKSNKSQKDTVYIDESKKNNQNYFITIPT